MDARTKLVCGAALWGGPLVVGIAIATVVAAADSRESDEEGRGPVRTATPEKLAVSGIENVFRLSPRLYSGGEPRGAEGLSALKELGIRTIISVDGTTPDVETARKLGLRYVHLPIGYDGVPRQQAVRIIKAARTFPGPVYVHCHHGMHRGPAAVAVCGQATEGWTGEQALAWLKQAGTSPNYRGLYAAAERFVPPTEAELERAGTAFPERAEVSALVEAMVSIDERWDRIKTVREAGFKTPADHPDLDPPHEALQLVEDFRELLRLAETQAKGAEFVRAMEDSEQQATRLEAALRELDKTTMTEGRKGTEEAFVAVGKACTTCHARYRDN